MIAFDLEPDLATINDDGGGNCGIGPGGFQPGNTCAKGGSSGSEDSKEYVPSFADHSATAIVRWMGREGFDLARARDALKRAGITASDATVRTQLQAGRTGKRGEPAKLDDEQSRFLRGDGQTIPATTRPPRPLKVANPDEVQIRRVREQADVYGMEEDEDMEVVVGGRTVSRGRRPKSAMEAATRILGPSVGSTEEQVHKVLAGLAGVSDGSDVTISYSHANIRIEFHNPDTGEHGTRFIIATGDGDVTLGNESYTVSQSKRAPGSGLGARMLERQAAFARAHGIKWIETSAGGTGPARIRQMQEAGVDSRFSDSGLNGYYTWPRAGYRAMYDLPEDALRELPEELKGARRPEDLMTTKAGRDWWREHGVGFTAVFDPSEGSYSMRVLHAYLDEIEAKTAAKSTASKASKKKTTTNEEQQEHEEWPDDVDTDEEVYDRVYERLAREEQEQVDNDAGPNCGIGEGGFQPGNTCAKGGGKASISDYKQVRPKSVVARQQRQHGQRYGTPIPDAEMTERYSKILRRDASELGTPVQQRRVIAGLVGAPDGADVIITPDGKESLRIEFRDEKTGVHGVRRLARWGTGQLVLENISFEVDADKRVRGAGIGAQMLARQVAFAQEHGVDKIVTYAAGSKDDPDYNGYYTWPRIGYDGDLTSREIRTLPDNLSHATRVSHLFDSEGGSDWWLEHGGSFQAEFDPKPGSRSVRILESYLKHKFGSKKMSTNTAAVLRLLRRRKSPTTNTRKVIALLQSRSFVSNRASCMACGVVPCVCGVMQVLNEGGGDCGIGPGGFQPGNTCAKGGGGGGGDDGGSSRAAAKIAVEEHTPPPPGKAFVPDVEHDANGDGVTDAARVGVPAADVPPPPRIGRLPNLTEEERAVESAFIEQFEADPDGVAASFREAAIAAAKPGEPPTFGTDDAKALSDDWEQPGKSLEERSQARATLNAALHQTANAIAKRAFLQHLDTLEPGDEIMVTVGGCGAGKGYSLSKVEEALEIKRGSKAVWDSAGDQCATENPWIQEEAERRGLRVTYVYVHADPEKQWADPERGVVKRAADPKDGRMVDAKVFADSYALGARNHKAFADKHKDNPNARFIYLKNPPERLDGIPKEALSIDRKKLAKFAQETVHKSGAPAHIRRGATIGSRIWEDD